MAAAYADQVDQRAAGHEHASRTPLSSRRRHCTAAQHAPSGTPACWLARRRSTHGGRRDPPRRARRRAAPTWPSGKLMVTFLGRSSSLMSFCNRSSPADCGAATGAA